MSIFYEIEFAKYILPYHQYMVGVYENQFRKLEETNKLEALEFGLYVLTDPAAYDPDTGLVVNMEDGIGIFL